MNYAKIIDAEKMLIYFFKTKLVNLYFFRPVARRMKVRKEHYFCPKF